MKDGWRAIFRLYRSYPQPSETCLNAPTFSLNVYFEGKKKKLEKKFINFLFKNDLYVTIGHSFIIDYNFSEIIIHSLGYCKLFSTIPKHNSELS